MKYQEAIQKLSEALLSRDIDLEVLKEKLEEIEDYFFNQKVSQRKVLRKKYVFRKKYKIAEKHKKGGNYVL